MELFSDYVSMLIIIACFLTTVYSSNSSYVLFNGKQRGKRHGTLFGLSMAECMDQCMARSRCQSVNYLRQSLQCRLNSFKRDSDDRLVYPKSGYIFVMLKDDSQSNQVQCGNVICSKYQNCVIETEHCVVTECSGLSTPTNGYKVGNTVGVGAKTMLYCNNNTYFSNNLSFPVQTICQADSTWTVGTLECFTLHDLCHQYLVSGPSGLLVESITASTTYDSLLLPTYAVLNGSAAWAATYVDQNPFLQVRFHGERHITGVATQGRNDPTFNQYVTSYGVAYSADCATFVDVTDSSGNSKVFQGNNDMNSIVTNQLESPVEALCVRIKAISWNVHPSMRIDILGYQ